jgi:phosphonate degradation associated HDIG domain protein
VADQSTEIVSPEALINVMVARGGGSYFGEPVTVLEHCLQAAHFAKAANSNDSLVIAALLHDIGHLLHDAGEDVADHGLDTHHEELGDRLLSPHLPDSVTQPIKLHVAAKRYLCAVDPSYLDNLSPSSILSLKLQGGPMTGDEINRFLALPFALEGVTLRRWDDEAKIPELPVEPAESYLPLLKSLWD